MGVCVALFTSCGGCSKEVEHYTPEQKKVLSVLHGQFAEFNDDGSRNLIYVFDEPFKEPVEYYDLYMGDTIKVNMNGAIKRYFDASPNYIFNCVYKLSEDGRYFTLYYIDPEGNNDKMYDELIKKYKIVIKGNDEFDIYDLEASYDRNVPHVFKREK